MSIDEHELLVGEDEFYDLWIDAQKRSLELADSLNLTDEDLKRIQTRWSTIHGPDGHALAGFASHALTIRSIRRMADMMRPGEEMVPLAELAARLKSGKGSA